MSNALAVAHVTQALALLIEGNLRPEIDMAVSVETRKPPAEPPTEPTITVFLYQVTHNPSMRNHDLPTRASDGTLVNKPVAALDLHYVISAYGEENELVGQRLVGCVARILREYPVLPADVIREAGERPYLAGSDLAESQQKVRLTPLQMDIDETSKLWGMLHQTPYALSTTYQASLVLIEGREEPERIPPVERTVVTVGASGTNAAAGEGGSGTSGASAAFGAAGPGAPGVSVVPTGRTDGASAPAEDGTGSAGAAPRGGSEGDPGTGPAEAGTGGRPGAAGTGTPTELPRKAGKPGKAAKKSAAKKSAAQGAAGRKTAGKPTARTSSVETPSAQQPSVKQPSGEKRARRTAAKKPSRGGGSGGADSGGTAAEGTEG